MRSTGRLPPTTSDAVVSFREGAPKFVVVVVVIVIAAGDTLVVEEGSHVF